MFVGDTSVAEPGGSVDGELDLRRRRAKGDVLDVQRPGSPSDGHERRERGVDVHLQGLLTQ